MLGELFETIHIQNKADSLFPQGHLQQNQEFIVKVALTDLNHPREDDRNKAVSHN